MREEIARVVPFYDGIQNLKNTGDAIQYGGPHLCAEGKFPTPDGKACFKAVELPLTPSHSPSDEESVSVRTGDGKDDTAMQFRVTTRRGKQFNSLIYAEIDPLNGAARDAVLMNADDAAALHLIHGDRIVLVNEIGRYEGHVFLAPLARGNLQIHWPEGNVIIRRGVIDPHGGVPVYKASMTIEKIS
jgi:anaerobic selenocysteine-containing dehydrogenase